MITHYVARRAHVIEDHAHNAADSAPRPLCEGRLWLGSGWICHPWVCEPQDGRRVPDVLALALKSVPGPSRDGQALGDVVSRLVVARHGRRGGPGEIVVQHLPEWPGRVQPRVLQRLVETGDRPAVHFR